ncbi:hypothetical protein [Serratia fonticola]|uniref:Uncharacterized protein n=1 Tax=Serratia fonticola TaxID=47917 RepID=A0AAW3WRM9_SERFO|nr:hypothetical protein [Serratia fonticola]MBC3213568.1 hypothetical protein [Serratia fonticola]NYA11472.1 hypothetical protein [Serratia fonticola]NYA31376.1 hypothetical protein [Serratia fonticola]
MTTAAQAVNNSPVVTVSTTVSEKYKRSDFIKVDQYILHATEVNGIKLTGNMKLVYMAMLSYQRGKKKVFYTMEQIAVMCGITERSAKTLVQTMIDAGLINEVQRRARKANVYNLNEYVIQEAVGSEQNANRPTAKRKPAPATMENQEQSNNVVSLDTGKPVQHCDPVPVNTNVIEEGQPDLLDSQIAAADLLGVEYNLTEMLHYCRNDRLKAADGLRALISRFHTIRQNASQKPLEAVVDGGFDDGWDGEDDAY